MSQHSLFIIFEGFPKKMLFKKMIKIQETELEDEKYKLDTAEQPGSISILEKELNLMKTEVTPKTTSWLDNYNSN